MLEASWAQGPVSSVPKVRLALVVNDGILGLRSGPQKLDKISRRYLLKSKVNIRLGEAEEKAEG